MLNPVTPVTIARRLDLDVYGQARFGTAMGTRATVVRLGNRKAPPGGVAARGRSIEEGAAAVLLFGLSQNVAIGDRVTVAGLTMEVVAVDLRFDASGRPDHREVSLEMSAV